MKFLINDDGGIQNAILECFKTSSDMIFVSPFLSENEVLSKYLLEDKKNVRFITTLDKNYVLRKPNHLQVIEQLMKTGCEVKVRNDLHAKLYIFDNDKVIISSANFTLAGLSHKIETGVLITDKDFVAMVINYVEKLWDSSSPITIKSSEDVRILVESIENQKNIIANFLPIPNLSKLIAENFGFRKTTSFIRKIGTNKIINKTMNNKETNLVIDKIWADISEILVQLVAREVIARLMPIKKDINQVEINEYVKKHLDINSFFFKLDQSKELFYKFYNFLNDKTSISTEIQKIKIKIITDKGNTFSIIGYGGKTGKKYFLQINTDFDVTVLKNKLMIDDRTENTRKDGKRKGSLGNERFEICFQNIEQVDIFINFLKKQPIL